MLELIRKESHILADSLYIFEKKPLLKEKAASLLIQLLALKKALKKKH